MLGQSLAAGTTAAAQAWGGWRLHLRLRCPGRAGCGPARPPTRQHCGSAARLPVATSLVQAPFVQRPDFSPRRRGIRARCRLGARSEPGPTQRPKNPRFQRCRLRVSCLPALQGAALDPSTNQPELAPHDQHRLASQRASPMHGPIRPPLALQSSRNQARTHLQPTRPSCRHQSTQNSSWRPGSHPCA